LARHPRPLGAEARELPRPDRARLRPPLVPRLPHPRPIAPLV